LINLAYVALGLSPTSDVEAATSRRRWVPQSSGNTQIDGGF
jgi:hypothetical protein